MEWWGYLIIGLSVIFIVFFIICLIVFRNSVIEQKEGIENAKSLVRILKAKYLQVLRKVGTTQEVSNEAQGSAYHTANISGGGKFMSGAFGDIDSNFDTISQLVLSLASEYQSAQQSLNDKIKWYNLYLTKFPRIILTKIFRYKKETYIDYDNLNESTKLTGFDENDI